MGPGSWPARSRSGRPGGSPSTPSACHRTPQRRSTPTIAPIAHTCSFAEIERAANKAAKEADAEQEAEDHEETGAAQYLRIALEDAEHNHGYVPIEGLLDLDDALALEAVIKAKAHALLADHPTLDLDERRAKALGQLATPESPVMVPVGGSW